MTWNPILGAPLQYVDSSGTPYSGAVLKAYAVETTTPISLATDTTGNTLVSSVELNALGYPNVSGNVIIPHVDQNYKLALYPTQDAADANSGAIWTIDNILSVGRLTELFYAESTGSSNSYVVSIGGILELEAGMAFMVKHNHTCTGSSTLTIDGFSPVNYKKFGSTNTASGDIVNGSITISVYDGTNLQIIGGLSATGIAASVLDYKLKVSSDDTTSGYLEDKITSSGGTILLTTASPSGNEKRNFEVNVGTGANQIVQLNGSSKLPAVDGSLLTNIPIGWTLISSQNPLGVNGIDFTNLSISNYSHICIMGIINSENATYRVYELQVSNNNGVSFSTSYRWLNVDIDDSSSSNVYYDGGDTSIRLNNIGVITPNFRNTAITATIFSPNTSSAHLVRWEFMQCNINSGFDYHYVVGTGIHTVYQTLNAFRIITSDGSATFGGSFQIYGIK